MSFTCLIPHQHLNDVCVALFVANVLYNEGFFRYFLPRIDKISI